MKKSILLPSLFCLVLFICISVLFLKQAAAQCPALVTVNNDAGKCGAVVNYKTVAPYDTLETFDYTGAAQTWVVPAGVTSIVAEVYGAQGAKSYGSGGRGV